MAKDIFEITEYIIENSDSKIHISTNGSMRTEEWWWNFGILGGERLTVTFAIDGHTQELHQRNRQGTNLKKVVEKRRLGVRPKDLDASGLLQSLQQTAQKQRGKLTKDDVGLLLTNIDRPPQFSRYTRRMAPYSSTALPGDTKRQEMWVLHSPPRADDSLAFAESHVSGRNKNNFVAISELENSEVDVPNVLVHLRGKPHTHNLEEKEVFVVEELQSELKQRESQTASEQSTRHGGSIQNQYNPL